jgi:tyrosinase
LRIEIRDLQANNPDQWNLYLLALDAFKKTDEKSDLSYYGIAGKTQLSYLPTSSDGERNSWKTISPVGRGERR